MADDRQFTHPNLGKEVRVEIWGRELRLIFVCDSEAKANSAATEILKQMKAGMLNITLAGKPTSIEDSHP